MVATRSWSVRAGALAAALCAVFAMVCAFALPAQAVPAKPGINTSASGTHGVCRSVPGELVTLDSLPDAPDAKRKAPGARSSESTPKALPIVAICVGFKELPYSTEYDWHDTLFSDGGLADYYSLMSGGAFTFTSAQETSAYTLDGNENLADTENDGIVHVYLDEARPEWGSGDNDDTMIECLKRVVELADPYVNFASYDQNADGKISTNELAVCFVVAGIEAAALSNPRVDGAFWSHAWSFEDAGAGTVKVDGTDVSSYIGIAEQVRENGKTQQEPISLLAHELGHYIGLPDLYDTESAQGAWKSFKVGAMSLMDSGTWTEDADGNYVPMALDAWSRCELGWVEPVTGELGKTYTLNSQTSEDPYNVLKLATEHEGEYYLLENRQASGQDVGIAQKYSTWRIGDVDCSRGGIVLWHIDQGIIDTYGINAADDDMSNKVNVSTHRPGVMTAFVEYSSSSPVGIKSKVASLSLDVATSKPYRSLPLFFQGMWNHAYDGYAQAWPLQLYGLGSDANRPSARMLSNTAVEFLDDPSDAMRIRVCERAQWLVSFDASPSTNSFCNEFTKPDGTLAAMPEPVLADACFAGWFTQAQGGVRVDEHTVLSADTRLYAHWGLPVYTISYVLGEGADNSANPTSYTEQDGVVVLSAPTRPGWQFVGWTGSNGQEAQLEVSFNASDKEPKNFEAHWTKVDPVDPDPTQPDPNDPSDSDPNQQDPNDSTDPDSTKPQADPTDSGSNAGKDAGTGEKAQKPVTPPAYLLAKGVVKSKKLKLSWTKVSGASGYKVYFASSKKKAGKLVKTVKGNKTFKWTKKGLKSGKAYQFYVVAYKKVKGKKQTLAKSLTGYCIAGTSKKRTNAKSVKLSTKSVSLHVGAKQAIEASVVKASKKKRLLSNCAKLRFVSSNKAVATVSAKGKVTARAAGSCKVYVLAANGVRKAVKVTVKS